MSYSDIVTQVKTVLLTVTGVGTKIYTRERLLPNEKAFKDAFTTNNILLGWTITREGSTQVDHTTTSTLKTHTLVIRGFYAFNDATDSENTMQNLIEAIDDKFRAEVNRELNEKADWIEPIEMRIFEPRMFHAVLVHYCELVLRPREEIQFRT